MKIKQRGVFRSNANFARTNLFNGNDFKFIHLLCVVWHQITQTQIDDVMIAGKSIPIQTTANPSNGRIKSRP